MKTVPVAICCSLILVLASSAFLPAQNAGQQQQPAQQQQPEFIRQGQQLIRQGKPEEALELYRKTLQTSPDSVPANTAAGNVLDLMGKGEDARKYFATVMTLADTPERKAG